MRATVPKELEVGRVLRGPGASKPEDGFHGGFVLWHRSTRLMVVCTDGSVITPQEIADDPRLAECAGWEHVSVSASNRCPTWLEMCHVKDLCWKPEEIVYQLHPAKVEYKNLPPFCLHLWRPVGGVVDAMLPPSSLVAP